MLTAPGRGAISVVRVWGPEALAIANAAFRPLRGRKLTDTAAGRLRVGRMGAGLGDEVVVVILDAARTEIEVQGHGGAGAMGLILDALRGAGAEIVPVAEACARPSVSRITAEAQWDLANAPTLKSAEILLEQLNGALEREIRAILGDIDELRPKSDSSSPFARAIRAIDALLERSATGLRVLAGWTVVLAGRPNVGKSRLFNSVAGFERAIVAEQPGTTRDVVSMRMALDGWPVEWVDTAGLRDALDDVEAQGVARAQRRQADADIVLLVLDRSRPLEEADRELIERYPKAMRVANKSDLPAAWDEADWGAIAVSAATQDGVPKLLEVLAERIAPVQCPAGAGVPFRARQVRLLQRARRNAAAGDAPSTRLALWHILMRGESQDQLKGGGSPRGR
jgi:tRNA modification GTPase